MKNNQEIILSRNVLFRDFSQKETEQALAFFHAKEENCPKGAVLHPAGGTLQRFGLVLEGRVQACEDDMDGNRMIMQNVLHGGSFGESLSFLRTEDPPVYIVAAADSRVLWMDPEPLKIPTIDSFSLEIKRRFTSMLAQRTLSMNWRIQVLSKRTLREKIFTFFITLRAEKGKPFNVPLTREEMADYLGANRSALSRELSRMKQEKLIDFRGSRFVIR